MSTDYSAKHALEKDAQNRAARTLVQGLAVDLGVAVAAVLLAWLPDADITSREAWTVVGIAATKSVLTALASWVMRAKIDGSPIPTPLPPADTPPPTEPEPEHVPTIIPGTSLPEDH